MKSHAPSSNAKTMHGEGDELAMEFPGAKLKRYHLTSLKKLYYTNDAIHIHDKFWQIFPRQQVLKFQCHILLLRFAESIETLTVILNILPITCTKLHGKIHPLLG